MYHSDPYSLHVDDHPIDTESSLIICTIKVNIRALFGVLPIVPLVISPIVPYAANGTTGLPMVPLGEPIVPLALPLAPMVLV